MKYHMHQCITLDVDDGMRWTCSGVYASPHFPIRCNLWNYLIDLRASIQNPWMLIRDFNEIILPSEQKGGLFYPSRANRFNNVLHSNNLIDLEYYGTKFTWQKPCRGNRLVSKRLDRAIGDHNWRMNFPEATVEHLVKRNSDHNPLSCVAHDSISFNKEVFGNIFAKKKKLEARLRGIQRALEDIGPAQLVNLQKEQGLRGH